jgi:23S rRNA (uracil1939-C5)-methyltransferase
VSDVTVTIERIGARGDGVARHEGKAVFVPFTAPGDVVRVRLARDKAELIEFVSRGARQEPPCPHFGQCGGCALQHLSDAVYATAKQDFVREALAHRGLDPDLVEPIRRIPPGTRRRARLAMKNGKIGFHQRASHRIVDMKTCAVLHPTLVAVVQALRRLGLDADVSLTLADSGVDLLIDLPRAPDLAVTEKLTGFAVAHDLARLLWRTKKDAPMPIVQRRAVRMDFAGTNVDLPPDCFLQATKEAEGIMRDLVLEGVGDAKTVADLFCGVGTFSFALAKHAKIDAVDGDQDAVAALRRAAAAISGQARDLERRPLLADELNRFDAVVFDPPYAGAAAQAKELAKAQVPRIVAVSCNPASFARDARALVDGGYRLVRVVPVDQFLWSAEVELVAHFARQ